MSLFTHFSAVEFSPAVITFCDVINEENVTTNCDEMSCLDYFFISAAKIRKISHISKFLHHFLRFSYILSPFPFSLNTNEVIFALLLTPHPLRLQHLHCINMLKSTKITLFLQNICVYEKFVLPLQPFSP